MKDYPHLTARVATKINTVLRQCVRLATLTQYSIELTFA
jgi:hypothetical protein